MKIKVLIYFVSFLFFFGLIIYSLRRIFGFEPKGFSNLTKLV
jgi:hypothetical protein